MSGWEALLPDYTVWQWGLIVLAFLRPGLSRAPSGSAFPLS